MFNIVENFLIIGHCILFCNIIWIFSNGYEKADRITKEGYNIMWESWTRYTVFPGLPIFNINRYWLLFWSSFCWIRIESIYSIIHTVRIFSALIIIEIKLSNVQNLILCYLEVVCSQKCICSWRRLEECQRIIIRCENNDSSECL